ncbi:uncharacterized protein LOC124460892 [Drosophila willistoni]|uniref:uncharacterized protein LOC124460892 n=2 Tax=Drosophila willistoni TaxID=7260 RepID=UPI001F086636|nr:uncharacterized protein LOC124460892 [Drosophila willistoni]
MSPSTVPYMMLFCLISSVGYSPKADASTQTEEEPNGQAAIMAELAILKEALATQTALMRHMAMGQKTNEVRRVCFPLESVLEIVDLEEQITPERSKDYTSQVSALLGQAALTKSIKKIFSEGVIESHNLDGKNGKLSLRTYPKVLNMIMEAVRTIHPGQPAEGVLRSALACAKNTANKAKNRKLREEANI